MAAPYTKTQLLALVNDYLQDTSPNIRSSEHIEIETRILDRIDARILQMGQFSKSNPTGYTYQDITFTPTPVYTTNYLVFCTIVKGNGTSWAISNKTLTGFRINLYSPNPPPFKVWYTVFSKDML